MRTFTTSEYTKDEMSIVVNKEIFDKFTRFFFEEESNYKRYIGDTLETEYIMSVLNIQIIKPSKYYRIVLQSNEELNYGQ